MKIRIVNHSKHPLPAYETHAAAGMDLRASLDAPVVLKPLERMLVPTGLFIEIPVGYEAQIRPRSGLAIKRGITLLNTPGTIDADYRGEIKIILDNLTNEEVEIGDGDLHTYSGNYADYLQKKEEERQRILAERLAAERDARLAEKRARQKEKELARKVRKQRA